MPSQIHQLIADLSIMQINEFFSERPNVTQDACDEWAARALGGPVHSCALQGVTSYTVEAVQAGNGEGVVQFRSPDDALDITLIQSAQEAYGYRFVPCPRDGGFLNGLKVYIMDNVGGVSAYLARDQLRANDGHLLRVTLKYFARFFASPWHNRPTSVSSPSRSQLYATYEADLKQLREGLSSKWHKMLDNLLQTLPLLFADDWPMVPNHTDLLENNIHVDSSTGHITGICDWKDTTVSPFGTSLWGVESMLGERTLTGWRWVGNSAKLRQGFWDAFAAAAGPQVSRNRVEDARLVGIFLNFGFEWVDQETKRPVMEGSSDFPFFEAITLNVDNEDS